MELQNVYAIDDKYILAKATRNGQIAHLIIVSRSIEPYDTPHSAVCSQPLRRYTDWHPASNQPLCKRCKAWLEWAF